MPPTVVVVIREDPAKNHRPVEALRIALGLASGENPVTVVLLDEATKLLTDDDDLVDGDILAKYLPSLKQLDMPFVVPQGAVGSLDLDADWNVREASPSDITSLIGSADRTLVF